jgi:hypothetical protein
MSRDNLPTSNLFLKYSPSLLLHFYVVIFFYMQVILHLNRWSLWYFFRERREAVEERNMLSQ